MASCSCHPSYAKPLWDQLAVGLCRYLPIARSCMLEGSNVATSWSRAERGQIQLSACEDERTQLSVKTLHWSQNASTAQQWHGYNSHSQQIHHCCLCLTIWELASWQVSGPTLVETDTMIYHRVHSAFEEVSSLHDPIIKHFILEECTRTVAWMNDPMWHSTSSSLRRVSSHHMAQHFLIKGSLLSVLRRPLQTTVFQGRLTQFLQGGRRKRCYEGLRGARFVSPFLRIFIGRFGGCWVVLCFLVCLLFFDVASENSTFD